MSGRDIRWSEVRSVQYRVEFPLKHGCRIVQNLIGLSVRGR